VSGVSRPEPGLIAMDFPELLSSLRNERGITQGTLAEHVNIHVSQLRRYEAGNPSPTVAVPRTLAISSRGSLRTCSSATRPSARLHKQHPTSALRCGATGAWLSLTKLRVDDMPGRAETTNGSAAYDRY
jgi:DNA-binding XRE family transcriptional regulator